MHDPKPHDDTVPASPDELLARQLLRAERPEKPGRRRSEKVERLLRLLKGLELNAWESQQITLTLLHRLENFHDHVVAELRDDAGASHSEIARWSVDADRLYRARMIVESIELE
jgi:hypothetical protein